MISARLKTSALYDTATGAVTPIPSGIIVLTAGDTLYMADGGYIPDGLLAGVAHQKAITTMGSRHALKRVAAAPVPAPPPPPPPPNAFVCPVYEPEPELAPEPEPLSELDQLKALLDANGVTYHYNAGLPRLRKLAKEHGLR